MTFLGWHQPLLHTTADWLLDAGNVPETPDLSGTIVVVRGRRAARRLLELLALKCAERSAILVPPEILTPTSLVMRLTKSLTGEHTEATPLASALAWAEAIRQASDDDRNRLFRRPGADEVKPGLRALLGLGKHLSQIWSELGGAGLGFREVVRVLGERFPNITDFEVPRWEVIESLHRQVGRILQSHDLIDETNLLISRAHRGEILAGHRIVLAGVAEMPRIVREFIARLPEPPTVLVGASETERDGFDEWGVIRAEYWNGRRAGLEAGQIHLVERDRDQALRVAYLVSSWRESSIAPAQMTLAVPDAKALPRLREALDNRGVKTRWAQGRPVADAPAFQLLRIISIMIRKNRRVTMPWRRWCVIRMWHDSIRRTGQLSTGLPVNIYRRGSIPAVSRMIPSGCGKSTRFWSNGWISLRTKSVRKRRETGSCAFCFGSMATVRRMR